MCGCRLAWLSPIAITGSGGVGVGIRADWFATGVGTGKDCIIVTDDVFFGKFDTAGVAGVRVATTAGRGRVVTGAGGGRVVTTAGGGRVVTTAGGGRVATGTGGGRVGAGAGGGRVGIGAGVVGLGGAGRGGE